MTSSFLPKRNQKKEKEKRKKRKKAFFWRARRWCVCVGAWWVCVLRRLLLFVADRCRDHFADSFYLKNKEIEICLRFWIGAMAQAYKYVFFVLLTYSLEVGSRRFPTFAPSRPPSDSVLSSNSMNNQTALIISLQAFYGDSWGGVEVQLIDTKMWLTYRSPVGGSNPMTIVYYPQDPGTYMISANFLNVRSVTSAQAADLRCKVCCNLFQRSNLF